MKHGKRNLMLAALAALLALLMACGTQPTATESTGQPTSGVTETDGDAEDVTAQIADLTEKMQQAADEGDAEQAEDYANQILALDSENEDAAQVLQDLNATAGSSMK